MAWKKKKIWWRWCSYPLGDERRFRKVHIESCRWHQEEGDPYCDGCDYFSEESQARQKPGKKVVHSDPSMFGVRDTPGRGSAPHTKVNGPWT
jgi:hypothetical protein